MAILASWIRERIWRKRTVRASAFRFSKLWPFWAPLSLPFVLFKVLEEKLKCFCCKFYGCGYILVGNRANLCWDEDMWEKLGLGVILRYFICIFAISLLMVHHSVSHTYNKLYNEKNSFNIGLVTQSVKGNVDKLDWLCFAPCGFDITRLRLTWS